MNAPDDSGPMCVCGHTAYWHSHDGTGDCEGTNIAAPGSFIQCECEKFAVPREMADVQADVNMILDTLLTGQRLVDEAHERFDTRKALVIDFALDAVKRLRKDAEKGVIL